MRSNALAIPQQAVQQGLGRQFVYVVLKGDTIGSRDVVPGPWTGRKWIIDSGLVAGDRIVVDGVQKIGPGRAVKPVEWTDSSGVAPKSAPAAAASGVPATNTPAASKGRPTGGVR